MNVSGKLVPTICAGFGLMVGATVLVGWIFELPLLKAVLPGFVAMKVNTAVGLTLAGLSLLLLSSSQTSWARLRAGQSFALIVALIGALTLGEEAFGWRLGIDQMLVVDPIATEIYKTAPGRMAMSSATGFLLLGLALFGINWETRKRFRPSEAFALLVVALAWVETIEYLFGRGVIAPMFDATRMAVHTIAAFFVLGIGVLAARPKIGVLGMIRGASRGPLERRIYVALGLSLFALLGTGAAAFFATEKSVARTAMVIHTHDVRTELGLLLATHRDVAIAVHESEAASGPEFAERFERARADSDRIFHNLSGLLWDNPVQTSRLGGLDALRRQHLDWATRAPSAHLAGNADPGRGLLGDLRSAIAQMDSEEARLLRKRAAEEHASVVQLEWTLLGSALFALGTIMAAGIILHYDIRLRHLAETALRDSEENLSTTLRSIGDAVLATDTQGGVTRMNPAAERLTGWSFADARGHPIEEVFRIINEETRAPATVPVAMVLETGEVQGLANHTILISRDGAERPIADSAAPIRDESGLVRGVVLVFRDATAERLAEETIREQNALLDRRVRERTKQLRESEEQLKLAQRLSHTGSIHINFETGKTLWSDETYRIFGVARETFIPSAESYAEMLHPEDRVPLKAMRDQRKPGQNPAPMEYRIVRPDGSVRHIYRELALTWDESGQPKTQISTIQDVTDRRRTENQLHQAQKMEAIGNLTGGMAHDFNNLLGVIIGNLELLRETKDGDIDELTQDALDAAFSGADLTHRLLAFARQQPLKPQRIQINGLVSHIVKLLKRTLPQNIEIVLDLTEGAWATVVDPAQLESTLLNLTNNSRDAMPDGGMLRITTANRQLDADYSAQHSELTPGDYVLIEVSDTGTGMTPEVTSRVFEPFFTTKERNKGTGLGLAMVFGFIKQSGAHINVYSEVCVGTVFRLYFPRILDGAERVSDTLAPPILAGCGETVLVVEDNAPLRRVVVRQLRELGYRVLNVEDAAAALETMERDHVDLMFTDMIMPGGCDGVTLAKQARERWPALKVVFTTGFAQLQTSGGPRSLPDGATLLTKPYRREELAGAIRATLDG